MISAFEIYLVFQLDSIRSSLSIAGAIASALAIAFCVIGSFLLSDRLITPEAYKKWSVSLGAGAAFLLLLAAVTPNSKTAAAMVVLPRIVNNESVQAEARDIYDLAKKGLQQLVSDNKEKAE